MEDNQELEQEVIDPTKAIPLKQNEVALKPDDDRLTVTMQMVHQHCCVDPVPVRPNFAAVLKNKEQPYQRRIWIAQEWKKLDYGWLNDDGLHGIVVVENLSGKQRSIVKKKDEQEDPGNILEIHLRELIDERPPIMTILPAQFQFFNPTASTQYMIRCVGGKIEYAITVMPR